MSFLNWFFIFPKMTVKAPANKNKNWKSPELQHWARQWAEVDFPFLGRTCEPDLLQLPWESTLWWRRWSGPHRGRGPWSIPPCLRTGKENICFEQVPKLTKLIIWRYTKMIVVSAFIPHSKMNNKNLLALLLTTSKKDRLRSVWRLLHTTVCFGQWCK